MLCINYEPTDGDRFICLAFPGGIPKEIINGEIFHTSPYEGDNGIQFDPIDEESKKVAYMAMGLD